VEPKQPLEKIVPKQPLEKVEPKQHLEKIVPNILHHFFEKSIYTSLHERCFSKCKN
jgi:hypothetical protein